MNRGYGLSKNGMTVWVESWPNKKLPVLCVQFDGADRAKYKVASFDSERDAAWFIECLEEHFGELQKGGISHVGHSADEALS